MQNPESLVALCISSHWSNYFSLDSGLAENLLLILNRIGCEGLAWEYEGKEYLFLGHWLSTVLDETHTPFSDRLEAIHSMSEINSVSHTTESDLKATVFYSIGRNGVGGGKIRYEHSLKYFSLPLICVSLSRRCSAFKIISPSHSAYGWNAHFSKNTATRRAFEPWPWSEETQHRVVTVVIDLRKSTFCMDNSIDSIEFAETLRWFHHQCSDIIRSYGGMFDKFTGDGVIGHFLVDMFEEIHEKSLYSSIMKCCNDIASLKQPLLSRIVSNLKIRRNGLGLGFGIDVGDCALSIGEGRSLVAVGSGVVTACRLSDACLCDKILVSNAFLLCLKNEDEGLSSLATDQCINTKEYADSSGIVVSEFDTDALSSEIDERER